ncbi:alpha/beta hydrolase family protein [Sphingomonas hengshuiensis]|uniref:alpha/beta hydrolase family protein n=1 Tax=Sphingomonas hengshuiensis TaxID=1609977 RepID=UPI0005CB2405|nr:alpha/beta hydrolase [Sphingomonas hengshuiensis]
MNAILTRRALLQGAVALGGLALLPPGLLHAQTAGPETIDLAVSSARSTTLTLWRPAGSPRGVLLFSTGHGSWPERYAAMVQALVADGYAVLAPLHVDSTRHPDRAKFDSRQGFFERIADMRATSAHAAKTFPDLPVAAMGHSYGALIALGMGGALANLLPMRDARVGAVLAFSSPGAIPGLVRPGAYAALAVPTMLITGTRDLVEGFVTDPADHLQPIEQSPAGDKYALVIAGGEHGLVYAAGTPGFARARVAAGDFLAAYVPANPAARARLAEMRVAPGDRFIVREG